MQSPRRIPPFAVRANAWQKGLRAIDDARPCNKSPPGAFPSEFLEFSSPGALRYRGTTGAVCSHEETSTRLEFFALRARRRRAFCSSALLPHSFQDEEMSMSAKTSIWINASMLVLALAWRSDALAAATAVPADADSNQTTVHFGDLNIDRPAGAAVLYRRIRAAARSVCGDPQPPGLHMTSPDWRRCV